MTDSEKKEMIDRLQDIKNSNKTGEYREITGKVFKNIDKIIDILTYPMELFPTDRHTIQLQYEKETGKHSFYIEYEVYENKVSVLIVENNGFGNTVYSENISIKNYENLKKFDRLIKQNL